MFRTPKNTRVRLARTTARIATLSALSGLALATASVAPAAPPWRAFAPNSIWNVPAAPQSIAPNNPYADKFAGSAGFTMKLSGTPNNPRYSSPIYFAKPGDAFAPISVGQPGWAPKGNIKWNGQPIPVPAGVTPASGSDGHLTVVSADRRTGWEFWRATAAGSSGYTTEVVVQWDLTGQGYSDQPDDNSARGSGTPLIATTLRADEALHGINHALGITVPSVSNDYVYPPATHADGNGGANAIKYGMLFVLRPDYPVPGGAPVGVRNVIQALKTYGAYVVDQGADFEMDADFTQPELWAQTGLNEKPFKFTGADMRPASAGVAPATPARAASKKQKARRRGRPIVIRAEKRRLQLGHKLRLHGKVRRAVRRGARVRIMLKSAGRHWRRLRRKPLNANRTFATWPRLVLTARASRSTGRHRYLLRDLHISRHTRVIKLRAFVRGVGRSNIVRVRISR
jgi:hypothetical protein